VIIDAKEISDGALLRADAAIVGAGPAGIITALELASSGREIILIESGRKRFDPAIQELAEASALDPSLHASMSLAVRRQLGGTSTIWGGRCVPYDPIDFEDRPLTNGTRWPIAYDELVPFFQRACNWLACGRAVFDATKTQHLPGSIVPGLPSAEVRTSALERWSLPTDFGREYAERLQLSTRVRVITGLTCTRIVPQREKPLVDFLECRSIDGQQIRVRGEQYVVACGGLDSTRLLLASRANDGRELGNQGGHLGRWYMGHVEGVIANVRFLTPPSATIYGYERDLDSTYVRRRFSFAREFQQQHDLPNIVAWLANPDLPDARHGSGPLSLAYLGLASPLGHLFAPDAQRLSLTGQRIPGAPYGAAEKAPTGAHIKNIVRDPAASSRFMAEIVTKRFLARRRKIPGFFAFSPTNVYPLQYHAEHLPKWESRVALSKETDQLGLARLRIDIRFSDDDVRGVVEAHRRLDKFLRRTQLGRIEYIEDDLENAVWRRIGGGFHQMGTTRMSAKPEDGVVDRDLRVHGIDNLHVASSSTFVTSSQANSTFMIAVFAVRLADHLDRLFEHELDGRRSCARSARSRSGRERSRP
jgi:GMC oxidoreductase